MRNLARIVVLGLALVAGATRADAAAITLGSITGFGTSTYEGGLVSGEDVALLTFILTGETLFDARTTSFSDPGSFGFDPILALFWNGSLFERANPADPGGIYLSVSDDIDYDGGNYDDRLTLTLAAGSYTLALLQYTNELQSPHLLDSDPWLDVAFTGDPSCPFGDYSGCRTGSFGLSVALTSPTPPPPASVPEPGTLTLLGLGAAGAALRNTYRRRRTPS